MEKDIKSFFLKKKRELSSNSNDGDEPKKLRGEESIETTDSGDVFGEELNSQDCVAILYSCMKDLEKQLKEIFILNKNMNERQIKGEGQLIELTKSVEHLNGSFEKLEKDMAEKDKKIGNLESQVSILSKKVEVLERGMDKQEQYSRRNCILLHGIEENDDEKTDEIVIKTV